MQQPVWQQWDKVAGIIKHNNYKRFYTCLQSWNNFLLTLMGFKYEMSKKLHLCVCWKDNKPIWRLPSTLTKMSVRVWPNEKQILYHYTVTSVMEKNVNVFNNTTKNLTFPKDMKLQNYYSDKYVEQMTIYKMARALLMSTKCLVPHENWRFCVRR